LVSNGCLRVIPGSHTNKILHPHLHEDRAELVLNQAVNEDCFNPDDAVDLELQPGQMSLHDVYMIHGAKANTSTIRRTGVAIRYMPTTSHFDRSLHPAQGKSGLSLNFATRPLWLLKGRDVCGLNDFHIGHGIAK
jgi:ectoine hydroxylase-related dioxygenase (phytanoyl-CoA dioxygenase family)